ncbi:MAG: hypothetical protein AcusKO_41690 [Acuticoccus sp.]
MIERYDRKSKRQRAAEQSEARICDAEGTLRAELGLLFRIHALSHVTLQRWRQNQHLLDGLSLVAWRVLLTVVNSRGLSANEIVRLWGFEKMSVNRAVSQLVERGLITADDEGGGRRIPLKATACGHDFYAATWPVACQDYDTIADALTPSQLAAFNRYADRLLAAARDLND